MKNFFIGLILTIIAAIILGWAAGKLTDRICNKPFSPEFKQTEKYKEMQCPGN